MPDLDAIRQAIEERDVANQRYHELATLMIYEGNSVWSWHSKANKYGWALLDAWDALKEAGVKCDGATTVAEGIRSIPKMAAHLAHARQACRDLLDQREALLREVDELRFLLDRSHGESITLLERMADLEAEVSNLQTSNAILERELEAACDRADQLGEVLARVRCCESACCPQCAEEIAALDLPQP